MTDERDKSTRRRVVQTDLAVAWNGVNAVSKEMVDHAGLSQHTITIGFNTAPSGGSFIVEGRPQGHGYYVAVSTALSSIDATANGSVSLPFIGFFDAFRLRFLAPLVGATQVNAAIFSVGEDLGSIGMQGMQGIVGPVGPQGIQGIPGVGGFKNIVINGNFPLWQRGTSLSAATGKRYLADRWNVQATGSTIAASRQAFALGQTDVPGNPLYFHRSVVASSAGTGNLAVLSQGVEGVSTLAGQNATLSFWAKADAARPMSVEFVQSFGTGGSSTQVAIGVTKVSLTTAWQKFTVTFVPTSVAGKTIGTGNTDNLQLVFWYDAGSTLNSRTNSLGQQSGTFDVAQVQMESGAVATDFETRPLSVELQLCQRYYEKSFPFDTTPANALARTFGVCATAYATTSLLTQNIAFKVTKRAVPTVQLFSTNVSAVPSGCWNFYNGSSWLTTTLASSSSGVTEIGFQVDNTFSGGWTVFQSIIGVGNWTADSEI